MASALRSPFPDPSFDRDMNRAVLKEQHPGQREREYLTEITEIVSPGREPDRLLSLCKQVSSVTCSVLLVAAGLAYGDQVYVDFRMNNARDRLTTLQDDAHQLSVSIEALKYQAAQLGESADQELIFQTPDHFIFVEPSLSRPERQATQSLPTAPPPQFPIGY